MAYHFDPYDNSIVIDGFEKGIAESPYEGISNMRNVNIISIPGEASVGFSTSTLTLPTFTGSVVSADATADTVTYTLSTGTATAGQALVFSGGSLPTGISAGTTYWIGTLVGSTFQLFTKPDLSSVLNITGTGTGTFVSTDMATPVNRDYSNSTSSKYIIDSNGRVWGTPTSGNYFFMGNTTLVAATGNGLVVYRGYLFVFRGTIIDYMSTTTFAWTYGWQTGMTSATSHQSLVGQDDVVYFCNASALGSFFQKPGTTFDPNDPTTFTFTLSALALPSIDTAQCLAELGINLLVGGANNAIYPWNRTSSSFFYPILISETNIKKMVTVNTNTYILAGARGRVYITNGSQAQLYKKIPDSISGTVEPFYTWGDLSASKNQIYLGVSAVDNLNVAINQYGGVWAIDLDTEALRLVNQLSYGTYAGRATIIIPQLLSSSPSVDLLIGWTDGSTGAGMDTKATAPYTGSQATIDTDLIPIGTFEKPRNAVGVEYKLSRPLVAGESIVIKSRTIFNTSDTGYTTMLTDTTTGDFSNRGAVNFSNAQWAQFQIVLNSVASSPSYVRLKQIRIKLSPDNLAS